jgi:selenocysteine lyase/cysteine desulfurase
MPSIKMPVKKLIELCKKYDTICILDAAHGVGIS